MNLLNIATNLLAVTTTSDAMRIIRIVCIAILSVCALALIVLVLLQPSASEGMGALNGQSSYDSFYSKNKVKTPEGIMKRLTVVISIVAVVVTVAFFITGIWFKF